MLKKYTRSSGFTLIELLVVVAIIGLLASMILASLSSARAQARDARRLSDMRQIRTALQMYYSDHGHFPCGDPSYAPDPGSHVGVTGPIDNNSPLKTILAPYMSGEVPSDPQSDESTDPGDVYFYFYDAYSCVSAGPPAAMISFNKAETRPANFHSKTDCGSMHNADFNFILGKSCRQL